MGGAVSPRGGRPRALAPAARPAGLRGATGRPGGGGPGRGAATRRGGPARPASGAPALGRTRTSASRRGPRSGRCAAATWPSCSAPSSRWGTTPTRSPGTTCPTGCCAGGASTARPRSGTWRRCSGSSPTRGTRCTWRRASAGRPSGCRTRRWSGSRSRTESSTHGCSPAASPPRRWPGEADRWRRFLEVAQRLRAGIDRRTLVDLLEDAWEALGTRTVLAASPHGEEQLGNLEVVRQLAARWDARGRSDPAAFARRLLALADRDPRIGLEEVEDARAGPAVQLLTVHAAKGLEWPVVCIADLGASRPPTTGRLLVDPRNGLAFRPSGALEHGGASDAPLDGAGRRAREPGAGREPPRPLRGDDPGPRSPRPLGHPGPRRATRMVRLGRPGAGHAGGSAARPPRR